MNIKLLAVVCAVAVLGLLAWLLFAFGGQKKLPPPTTPSLPAAGSVQPNSLTSSASISIPGLGGGTVSIQDPTLDPKTSQDQYNPDYYYLGYHVQEGSTTDPTATVGAPYIIEYIRSTHYFGIVLLKEPIGSSRQAAEQYLMQHLGITESDMCRLDYTVAVPYWVNQAYTGKNLGFSFCPGATVLPQ